MNKERQKITGSFYTQSKIVESMVDWAIRKSSDCILEPSFGDGIFINKLLDRYKALGNNNPNITAVEIQSEIAKQVRSQFPIKSLKTLNSDFLSLKFENFYDAVIGNPPYIGIKNLPLDQRISARNIIKKYNTQCPNNGSLWFPFVLHSINSIKSNGRLAFVLPFEITYTRYAYGLWKIMSQYFSKLSICRIFEDFFPNVDVETIILFAEGKGGKTLNIEYNIFNTVNDLINNNISQSQQIALENIINCKKPFISSILNIEHHKVLNKIKRLGIVTPIIESCKFKIGYVSADKNYFHPNKENVKQYSIPKTNLLPSILNSKELNGGTGIDVSAGECSSNLYFPKKITKGDKLYIQYGEKKLVHQRYKCRQRNPWYITPNVEIPDIILSVFGETPKMVYNKGKYAVSNSLLCGYLKNTSAKQLVCRWYNSLTLLSLELNVHSLGGGSFVIIPGEADRLEIINNIPQNKLTSIYSQLNKKIKTEGIEAAYILGDKLVLKEIFKLSDNDLKIIRQAISLLKKWRTPAMRK